MTVVAGCDVGSLTSKAVIMKDNRIIGSALIRSRAKPQAAAEQVLEMAIANAGISRIQLAGCVGTGYGRERIPFVDAVASEIRCHAKGACWMAPAIRTIIDIGGQDCKVIRVDERGEPVRFVTNDKCASGTGRFLEVMAKVLEIDIGELGEQNRRSTAPVNLASTCTVWAQADVISHLHAGIPTADIAAGVNLAMAKRVATLVNSVQPEKEICMTGGVAKNSGVVAVLESLLGNRMKKLRKSDPQLAGAIGAALIAADSITGRGAK